MNKNETIQHESCARDLILEEMGQVKDLPALGQSIANIIALSMSETKAVQEVTSFVLSDPALTQKILQLANSAHYRNHTGLPITTVSRAIILLGLNTIQTSALAMTMAEHIGNAEQSHAVRTELVKSFYASTIAREINKNKPSRKGAEDAVIAALFSNLGELMTAAYAYDKYVRIADHAAQESLSFDKAALAILGCSFAYITEKMLHKWDIPESIIKATQPLLTIPAATPKMDSDWVRLVSSYSAKLTKTFGQTESDPIQKLLRQYSASLDISETLLTQILDAAKNQVETLVSVIGLEPKLVNENVAEIIESTEHDDLPLDLLLTTLDTQADNSCFPSGKPVRAREMLTAGIAEMASLGISNKDSANEAVLHVLETLYRSLGVRTASLFLKDSKTGLFKPRIALGDSQRRWKDELVVTVTGQDVISLAVKKGVEIVINDTSQPKIAAMLPTWHKTYFFDTKSFIVLPIVVNKSALGLFYAERVNTAPEGVSADEAALIKILCNQVVAILSRKGH